jgi:hypothetical protein
MLDLETHLAAELACILGVLADLLLLDNLCKYREGKRHQQLSLSLQHLPASLVCPLTSQTGTVAGSILAHNPSLLSSLGHFK